MKDTKHEENGDCLIRGKGYGAGTYERSGKGDRFGYGKGNGHCDGEVWGRTKTSKAIILGRLMDETLKAAYGSGSGCFSGAGTPRGRGDSGVTPVSQRWFSEKALRQYR